MNFEIPPGLTDMLQDFTIAVLRARPTNLEQFAAQYFTVLNDKKNGPVKNGSGCALRFQDDAVNAYDRSDEEDELSIERGMFARKTFRL